MEDAELRIEYFERMLADNPDNPTGLLALANEYEKAGRYEDAAAALEHFVETNEDEGNAHKRLAEARLRLGDEEGARTAYEGGVRKAEEFGHEGMAEELRRQLAWLGN